MKNYVRVLKGKNYCGSVSVLKSVPNYILI